MTVSRDMARTSESGTLGGLAFLATTSLFWGLSWPISKFLLTEWPPLTARALPGLVGGAAMALYALAARISLHVPRAQWPPLITSALLNVGAWMAAMGFALLTLSAGEGAIIAYTMPIWTALLAWPMLGERPTVLRILALVLAFAGLAALFAANGIEASLAKLPGALSALAGAVAFAFGTILLKQYPIKLPAATSAAWQFAIGGLPVVLLGLLFEHPSFQALTSGGWGALAYLSIAQFCVAYVAWFAALKRLPASVAAIGTMLVPVIGVVAAAAALGEPLGLGRIAALACTVTGVALAARS